MSKREKTSDPEGKNPGFGWNVKWATFTHSLPRVRAQFADKQITRRICCKLRAIFLNFPFKSGQTEDPFQLNVFRDVYICPVKSNLIKGQTRAGSHQRGFTTSTNQSLRCRQEISKRQFLRQSETKKGLRACPNRNWLKRKGGWCAFGTMQASVLRPFLRSWLSDRNLFARL